MIDIYKQDIQLIVERHGFTVEQVLEKNSSRERVEVRDKIIRHLRDSYKLTLKEIGYLINRDHSTVRHSLVKTGGTKTPKRQGAIGCSVEGCDRVHHGHGLCVSHLRRWRKYNDTKDHIPLNDPSRGGKPKTKVEKIKETYCEKCLRPTIAESRWCGLGKCNIKDTGKWSWSRAVA